MILFSDYPSNNKWPPYLLVDKELKFHKISPILPSETLWDFSRKEECDFIVKKWQMYFQASNYKERNFLNLNNNDSNPICPTYLKNRAWLKHCSLSNLFCACITRLMTNHAPIGEYRQRFFPNASIPCPCSNSPIETRSHILHGCEQYKKSWNPK